MARRARKPRRYRVFFSHSGVDTYLAKNFFRQRIEETGASLFLDAGEIRYGDDFRAIIIRELGSCNELLVLLTPSALHRAWVFAEIGALLMRATRIVAVRCGTSEADLHEKGVLSILGTSNLLVLDQFDQYIDELADRVKGAVHG